MKKLKIKLSKEEVMALSDLLLYVLEERMASGLAERLVLEVMNEVLLMLYKMLNNEEQVRFTLRLTGAQSIAFLLLFHGFPLESMPYEEVLVHRISEVIHKTHINARYH